MRIQSRAGLAGQHDLVERQGTNALDNEWSRLGTGTPAGISGGLTGGIELAAGVVAPFTRGSVGWCYSSAHGFEMVKR